MRLIKWPPPYDPVFLGNIPNGFYGSIHHTFSRKAWGHPLVNLPQQVVKISAPSGACLFPFIPRARHRSTWFSITGCAHGAPVTHLDQGRSRCTVLPLANFSAPENLLCRPLSKGREPHWVRTGLWLTRTACPTLLWLRRRAPCSCCSGGALCSVQSGLLVVPTPWRTLLHKLH